MYIINGVAFRLEHVSVVGALSRVPGKPENVVGFRLVILGHHEQMLLFDSPESATAAHSGLLTALTRQGQGRQRGGRIGDQPSVVAPSDPTSVSNRRAAKVSKARRRPGNAAH